MRGYKLRNFGKFAVRMLGDFFGDALSLPNALVCLNIKKFSLFKGLIEQFSSGFHDHLTYLGLSNQWNPMARSRIVTGLGYAALRKRF